MLDKNIIVSLFGERIAKFLDEEKLKMLLHTDNLNSRNSFNELYNLAEMLEGFSKLSDEELKIQMETLLDPKWAWV